MIREFLALSICACCATAGAHQLNPDECRGLAGDVIAFFGAKSKGVKFEKAQERVTLALQEAAGQEGSYIKDPDDVALVLHVLESVYKSTETSPGAAYDNVLNGCQAAYYKAGGA